MGGYHYGVPHDEWGKPMTAKGDRANHQTGQHTRMKGADPGPGSNADKVVQKTFADAKKEIDETPFMPNRMG